MKQHTVKLNALVKLLFMLKSFTE